ncbi:polysaccharide deacetylase family protein [Methylacidimicrobium sp. B4]|uniref:polysaccharide deacetylase family protein n=1 Tax=Methylacidimicrobium sp. B4 TaxID=2796139 RepID=UPI001A8FDF9D|nr:polysaccharide deacetylase family protein [Methylacidimicrobium sp. B4]QSR84665.1 polysaccharide deacetylase family protein [Methylacidimicrobium sp. B4]
MGRWRPSRTLLLSLWLNGALLSALPLFPKLWPWLLTLFLADQLVLTLAGLWPRSSLLGPNLVCLPPSAAGRGLVALTFDDGPDPQITPAILDLLDAYGAKASFFCIGNRAERHADLVKEIARRGHSVENHSLRHSNLFACSGPGSFRREIERAQAVLSAASGTPPRFFRAPMGFRNPFLDPVLARLPLRYVSWTRRGFDTACREPEIVLRRLTRNLAEGDILLLHDGSSARTSEGAPVSVQVLSALLPLLRTRGLRAVSLPMAMGDPPEA